MGLGLYNRRWTMLRNLCSLVVLMSKIVKIAKAYVWQLKTRNSDVCSLRERNPYDSKHILRWTASSHNFAWWPASLCNLLFVSWSNPVMNGISLDCASSHVAPARIRVTFKSTSIPEPRKFMCCEISWYIFAQIYGSQLHSMVVVVLQSDDPWFSWSLAFIPSRGCVSREEQYPFKVEWEQEERLNTIRCCQPFHKLDDFVRESDLFFLS